MTYMAHCKLVMCIDCGNLNGCYLSWELEFGTSHRYRALTHMLLEAMHHALISGDFASLGDRTQSPRQPLSSQQFVCPQCNDDVRFLGEEDYFCLDCDWDNLQALK